MKSFVDVGNEETRRESVFSASEDGSETVQRRKLKYGGPLTAAWALFADFSSKSTVHGVKYLGERRRHWTERAFWVIAILMSVGGCSWMIHEIYDKWQNSPVIVTFAEKTTPVWNIPYPAVTICPQIKVRKKILNFTEVYNRMSNNETLPDNKLKMMEALAQVCEPGILGDEVINSSLKESEIVPLLKKIAPSLTESFMDCHLKRTWKNCANDFTEILTEEGICYTFNNLNYQDMFKTESLASDYVYSSYGNESTDWTLEDGYETNSPGAYPRRVIGTGIRASLAIMLKVAILDKDYLCRGPEQGFKISLHTPGEIPRISKQFFHVPSKQGLVVSVEPNMMTTSKGLVKYSPERRQCYFNNERNLQFFKVYTQSNCELECLANFTLERCKCAKFSMPRVNSTKICGQRDVKCYDNAEDDLMLQEVEVSLASDTGERGSGRTHCDCLPACTSISYKAELSPTDFDYRSWYSSIDYEIKQFDYLELAYLTIFFKEAQFITTKRSELYGWKDFLANCGGLLGLFMGFSILSLVEILYYVTLRLACNLKYRRNRTAKIQQSNQIEEDILTGIKVCSPETNPKKTH